jgi:hypothetical protein
MPAVDVSQAASLAAEQRATLRAGLIDPMDPDAAESLRRVIRSMTVELGSHGVDLADVSTCDQLIVFHVWLCNQLMPHLDHSPAAVAVLRTVAAGLTCAPGVPR